MSRYQAEIITDMAAGDVVPRMRKVIEDVGWVEGTTSATPHRGRLSTAGRDQSASYDLLGVMPASDLLWTEKLAADYRGRVAYLGWHFAEWTDATRTTYLDDDRNGEFRGVAWYDIEEGTTVPTELPREFVRALKQENIRADDLFEQLASSLYGERTDADEEILLEFYHPYDASLQAELAPVFSSIRDLVPREGQVSVEGLATFNWRELVVGGHIITASPHDALIECVNGGPAPEISVDRRLVPDLTESEIVQLEGHLGGLCARTRDGEADVLLGAGLAMGVSELEGYEGRNPRTGRTIKVPPRQRPYFVGW